MTAIIQGLTNKVLTVICIYLFYHYNRMELIMKEQEFQDNIIMNILLNGELSNKEIDIKQVLSEKNEEEIYAAFMKAVNISQKLKKLHINKLMLG